MRRLMGVALLISAAAAPVGGVFAGDTDPTTISAGVQDGQNGGGNEQPAGPPTCGWDTYEAGPPVADMYNVVQEVVTLIISVFTFEKHEVTLTYYSESNVLHRYDATSGLFEYRRDWACPEGAVPQPGDPAIGTVDWEPAPDPDPSFLLVRTIIDTETVKPPVPRVSPPPVEGVPVNFGVWFAVDPAGPYEAWAGFNDRVWARRTATLVSTTFDPGNGDDPVVCEGYGTPIPDIDMESVEEGPCGYTYTAYDDVVDDLTVTITSRWAVRWELSNGQSGDDPDILTSTSFPYDVYEIQTVGRGG